jgi:hypothetical protein
MSTDKRKPPVESEKTARRGVRTKSLIDIDREPREPKLTDRIEGAKNEYIKALEKEKRRLLGEVDQLQAMVDRLAPENARLREAYGNAVAHNILATILVAIGGGAIRFATFAEGASKVVAWVGAALLGAGVVILIFATRRGRATKPAQPS